MTFEFKKFLSTIPYRDIWKFVWPQTIMMLCTIVVSLTDVWTAGKINPDTQAAIGISAQLQAFLMVIGTSIGVGAMASVSQSIGAKNYLRAKRYTGLVIIFVFIMAFIVAGISYTLRYSIMSTLHVPDSIIELAVSFFIFVLCGLPSQYIMHVSATLFRAHNNVKTPLYIVGIVASVNVIGDLTLGLGYFGFPAIGGIGIAIATLIAFSTGALIALITMFKTKLFIPKIIPPLAWVRCASPYLIKVASPAILMQTLWQVGYLTLFGIMASLPDSVTALAGMTSGMRLESILFMPAVAFNTTASMMVGNAIGAGNINEARRIGLAIIIFGAGLMSIIGAIMWPFIDILAGTFTNEPDTKWNIATYLTINILSTPFTVGGLIVNGIFTGAGATVYALYINPFCIWGIRLPLAWFLAHQLGYGSIGVYFAMLISMAIQASSMFYIFLTKNWPKYAMKAQTKSHDTKCA